MKSIDEEGVSEVIGAILLVSLAVLGVAIVAVALFSQPAPAEIPHVSVVAGASDDNTTFVLFHEGGDPLNEGNYRIYMDTGSGLVDRTDDFTLSGDDIWSISENLTYSGGDVTQIERVVVSVVDSGGGETVIAEPAYRATTMDAGGYVDDGGAGSGPGITPVPTPTPDPLVIVGPEFVNEIYLTKDFDFVVKLEHYNAKYVHMVMYNYDALNAANNRELQSKIIALNLTPSESAEFYYNHTLKTTTQLGGNGDRISVTAIAYDINDTIIASESMLSILNFSG
jgi:FlaG/FlaF family flagellin (archaellin)